MSSSANTNDAITKADQIAHRFFSKFPVVISNARSTDSSESTMGRSDKWFNLETVEKDIYKDHLRVYRSISNTENTIPSLEMQVLLSIPELASNQALVYLEEGSSRVKVEPTPQFILLESWTLSFTRIPSYQTAQAEVTLPTVYKHSISVFRSLYTLLRILPVWDLFKRLRRTAYNSRNGALAIQVNLGEPLLGVLDFGTPISSRSPPLTTDTHTFPPISHPFGSFKLEAKYLSNPTFRIDSLETLLSSGYLGLDGFTPTLSKNSIQAVSPPGSLPLRTSLPHSPPANPASVADRFVLTRPSSVSSTAGVRNIPLPISRDPSQAASNSSPKERPEFPQRQRTESLVSNLDRPFPSPLSVGRPSIPSPVQPFKSGTISSGSPSSTSFRQASPLAGGLYLPTRTTQAPRVVPSSGPRPSPPYTPSSLGDRVERRSIGAGSSVEAGSPGQAARPPTKRYSSSFSHRHAMAGGGAGSEGSGNSGEKDRKDEPHPRQGEEIDLSGSPRDLADVSPSPSPAERQRRSSAPVMSLALHPIQPPSLTNLSQLDDTISQMAAKFQATLDSLGASTLNRDRHTRSPSLQEVSRRPSSRVHTPQGSPALRGSDLPSDYSDYRTRGGGVPSYVGTPSHPPIPTGISSRDRERLGTLPQARVSYETIASDDSPRAGGSVGSEEIIGRLEIDDRPLSLRRRY